MDLRLREIAGQPAGTYFIVNDNTTQSDVVPSSNLRVVFVNTELGNPNVAVVFKQGDIAGFNAVFGKQSRKKEKQGNYSISTVETMLASGPVVVINLRKFDSELDTIQVSGISPNKTLEEVTKTPYEDVFNKNGFWTFKGKSLPGILKTENLINFANVGSGNVSYFVTPAASVDKLTNEGDESLVSTSLEIEEYPALNENLTVKDTFVDVWIFKNDLSKTSATTNKYFGHLFNEAGLIDQENLEVLSTITEAGFVRKVTGSVIPYLKSENNDDLSIDVLLNSYYLETGLACYLNDDVLEFEDLDDAPIINPGLEGFFDFQSGGELKNGGNLLSYRIQPVVDVPTITYDPTNITDVSSYANEVIVKLQGANTVMSDDSKRIMNQCYGVHEHGIRVGDLFLGLDAEGNEVYSKVKQVKLVEDVVKNTFPSVVNLNLKLTPNSVDDSLEISPKLPSTFNMPVDSVYDIEWFIDGTLIEEEIETITSWSTRTVGNPVTVYAKLSGAGFAWKTTVTAKVYYVPGIDKPVVEYVNTITEDPAKTWKKVIYVFDKDLSTSTYYRIGKITSVPKAKLLPTTLAGYVKRTEQFTNGSAIRQNEILDMINSPSIRKGLKSLTGVRYIVDAFKSFVEPSYKYQYGLITKSLQEECNKFVNAIVNEPFIEDLDNSKNPLFKATPNGTLDIASYLATGGNADYSTTLLTKFSTGAEYCYFFGIGNVERSITRPGAGNVSSLFINKTFQWDVLANETGYVDGINELEINPDDQERGAMEKFRWNPVIIKGDGYTIFGNLTGQRTKSALQEIHNAELLSYIKESLYNMSLSENFKKGTYSEYLAFQTEVQSFMDNLSLSGAIKPNPIVICNSENNTNEVQSYKIKLVRVEYENITALDKVVFELNLN